jgi:Na+-transporting NADH:ubiquinone oxidoreductase subunit NqrB
VNPILANSIGQIQQLNYTTSFNKTINQTFTVNAFLHAITNMNFKGASYFNLTTPRFINNIGSTLIMTLYFNYSVPTQFCITSVILHLTNLKNYDLLNATATIPFTVISSNTSVPVFLATNMNLNPVYGPNFN